MTDFVLWRVKRFPLNTYIYATTFGRSKSFTPLNFLINLFWLVKVIKYLRCFVGVLVYVLLGTFIFYIIFLLYAAHVYLWSGIPLLKIPQTIVGFSSAEICNYSIPQTLQWQKKLLDHKPNWFFFFQFRSGTQCSMYYERISLLRSVKNFHISHGIDPTVERCTVAVFLLS